MTVHVGILGAGNISDTHARAVLAIPGAALAAVYGANAAKAERMAAVHGGTAYRDIDAFLRHRPMDLVAIGSPAGRHADEVIPAAPAGVHGLCAKPLGLTTAQVGRMVKGG